MSHISSGYCEEGRGCCYHHPWRRWEILQTTCYQKVRFHIYLKSSKQGINVFLKVLPCVIYLIPLSFSIIRLQVVDSKMLWLTIPFTSASVRSSVLAIWSSYSKTSAFISSTVTSKKIWLHPNRSSSWYRFIHKLEAWNPYQVMLCVVFVFHFLFIFYIIKSYFFNLFKVQTLCIELNRLRDQARLMELDRYLLQWCLSDRSMFK